MIKSFKDLVVNVTVTSAIAVTGGVVMWVSLNTLPVIGL